MTRTYQGRQWTVAEYTYENEKGLPGRQYGVRDWSRANLNFEVVKKNGIVMVQPIDHSKPSLQDRWQRRIDEGYTGVVRTKTGIHKKPIKKSEIKMVMFDLGGNRERLHEMAFDKKVQLGKKGIGHNGDVHRREDIEKWAKECYEFMAKKYGAENIIEFVVHLDETNPHIHCIIVPLTQDGKLSYTELFGGSHTQAQAKARETGDKADFRKGISDYHNQLHTEFANEVGSKWGLERGDSIKITGAVHKSTAESLREKNRLEEEIAQLDDTKERKSSSILTLTSQQNQLQGKVEELKEASRRADENLTLKNQALAKLGMKPVRPTTEVEDENERLKAEKEQALKIAKEKEEKASKTAATLKKAISDYDKVVAEKQQLKNDHDEQTQVLEQSRTENKGLRSTLQDLTKQLEKEKIAVNKNGNTMIWEEGQRKGQLLTKNEYIGILERRQDKSRTEIEDLMKRLKTVRQLAGAVLTGDFGQAVKMLLRMIKEGLTEFTRELMNDLNRLMKDEGTSVSGRKLFIKDAFRYADNEMVTDVSWKHSESQMISRDALEKDAYRIADGSWEQYHSLLDTAAGIVAERARNSSQHYLTSGQQMVIMELLGMASTNEEKTEILDALKEKATEKMGDINAYWKKDAIQELENLSKGVVVEHTEQIKR